MAERGSADAADPQGLSERDGGDESGRQPGAGVGLRGAAGGQGHPKKTKTCAQHARIYWTDQSVLDQQPVPSLSDSYYYYIDPIMIHEFGHTFGLPDFYADTTGLQGLPAVMDDPIPIRRRPSRT